jgi:hypothetical protein
MMVLLAFLACGRKEIAPAAPAPFVWPVPEGWRPETIPFPLDFAKELPYHGVEELRFAPDFFEPSAPTYFSYAFVWWLEGQPDLGPDVLERDLVAYFAGLCDAVAKKNDFDPAHFRAELDGDRKGQVFAYDPFATGGELTLQVEISVQDCAERRVLLALLSPRSRPDPVWDSLDAVGRSFACP